MRRLTAQGAIHASVVFDDEGRVLVADMSGMIQAFSPRGNRLWRMQLTGGISATPAVHPTQSRVFAGTQYGFVYALDIIKGAVLWKTEIPTQSDPRILSDLLYMPQADAVISSSWGGRFHALDASTGSARFTWGAGISPAAAVACDRNGSIYCLRAIANRGIELVRVSATGEEKVIDKAAEQSRGAWRSLVMAAPVIDEDREILYYICNQDRQSQLRAWNLKSNLLQWSCPLGRPIQATPLVRIDGVILVPDLAGHLNAIRPDGSLLFRYNSGCDYLLSGGVSDADGNSYFGDPFGALHKIDKQGSGKAVFEAKRSLEARPSFDSSGNLYVPSTDRSVFVFASK